MLVMDQTMRRFSVFIWNVDTLMFEESNTMVFEVQGRSEGAVPGDYDYDGLLDVMVTWSNETHKTIEIFLQKDQQFLQSEQLIIDKTSHPVTFDIDGDMKLEIISNYNNSVKIFKYSDQRVAEVGQLSNFASQDAKNCLEYEEITFTFPHTVAFVDLNKDCSSDLFMTVYHNQVQYFEVWLNSKNGKYCKVLSEKAPDGARQVSFADIDRDGIEDIIFPICLGINCSNKSEIHIVYNKNKVSDRCEFNYSKLATFKLNDFSSEIETSNKAIIKTRFPLSDIKDFPLTARFGDFDQDGYPDLLLTLHNSSGNFIEYLKNSAKPKTKERYFEYDFNELANELQGIPDALNAYFFDIDEKGILDVLVLSQQNGNFIITSLFNNIQSDKFRLKALALNGHGPKGYSSAYPGAVFMFTLTEMDMSSVVIEGTQMPLTAFFALATPYNVFGLGRTNSYIEEFFLALPLNENNFRTWTPVIPNSYLIASPSLISTDAWFLELFAAPTDKIEIIIGVSFGCMVIIGTVVILNYCKDKRENRKLFGVRVLD